MKQAWISQIIIIFLSTSSSLTLQEYEEVKEHSLSTELKTEETRTNHNVCYRLLWQTLFSYSLYLFFIQLSWENVKSKTISNRRDNITLFFSQILFRHITILIIFLKTAVLTNYYWNKNKTYREHCFTKSRIKEP